MQAFDDGASVLTRCSVEGLKSLLNPDEARNNRLNVNSYKNAVHQFCNEGKSNDKVMIVAFEKKSSDPSGLILLKKRSYEARSVTPLPGLPVPSDMKSTSRKLIWEVSYCVRRVDQSSKCLGDILLSCAIEEVRNRAEHDPHGACTYIWLVLAGGLSNVPALRLYLAHGFEVIGMYEDGVLMAVRNVGDDSTRRVLKQVTGKLESTFLLPILKSTAGQPLITFVAPNDIIACSSSEAESQEVGPPESQNSQSTVVSGVELFSQKSSVATEKATPECDLQGASRVSELEIESASPQETQEDQYPHSVVSDEASISEQSPAAAKERENTVEQEDEGDEVSKK